MDGNGILKRFEGAIDLKKPGSLRPFEVVYGDTGNVLVLTVTDLGEPADLTGCFVKAVFSSSVGLAVEESPDHGVTVDESEVTVELYPSSFGPGVVECELQIYSSTEEAEPDLDECDLLVTTERFNFTCRGALLSGETIPTAPGFPLLSETTAEIAAAEAQREAAEAARAAAESGRVAAEELRAAAENARALAESSRAAAESNRAAAESARQTAETARVLAETRRVNAEDLRSGRETARAAAETNRAAAETARAAAETARAAAETERAAAESAREAAETARAAAETERAAAEAARESAESARESAEEAREQALASYIEGAGLGVKTGSAAPSMSGLSEPGRIYHRLTTGETFIRENGGGWLPIAYERPWETVSSFTLNSSCSAIEIGVSSGGAPFAYDELRLTYVGSMHSSAVVGVYVNGYASAYVRDSAFALTDPSVSGGCATVLRAFRSSAPGFIETERRCGGIADTNGSSATKALHTGFIKPSSASALTAIKLAALSGGSFVSGATVILEGRNGL